MIAFFLELGGIEWLGILGSFLIAGAYFSVSNNLVNPQKPTFHLLNLIGSIFILISLFYKPSAGAILIELLWVLIAIFGLLRYIFNR